MAYDGSDAARRALAHAADLSRPDDRLAVVNVMPEPGVGASIGPPSEQLRQQEVLDDARRFLAQRGLQPGTLAPIGNAVSEILRAAEQVDADVVVLARRRGPRSHLLGSTSSHVVRSAKCDVLVVHEGDPPRPRRFRNSPRLLSARRTPPSSRLARLGWEPSEPPRRPVLFVNPRSGGGAAARAAVPEQARERGIEAIVLGPDDSLPALVREVVSGGADALGMAGGDGSLAVVAAAARTHGLPFVCVPAGTRNHFALDLGVDRHDLDGALEAFSAGVERRIDVAEVNGRVFLNNVSLGIYGDAVQRPAYRDSKVRTLLETAQAVLGPGGAVPELRVVDDLGHEHAHPAVVLVSNNPYALDRRFVEGTRPSLSGGRLGIIVLDPPAEGGRRPGRAWNAPRFEASAAAPVQAGVDGEAVELEPQLEFLIRPRALRVRISARHPGASPSGRRDAGRLRGRR